MMLATPLGCVGEGDGGTANDARVSPRADFQTLSDGAGMEDAGLDVNNVNIDVGSVDSDVDDVNIDASQADVPVALDANVDAVNIDLGQVDGDVDAAHIEPDAEVGGPFYTVAGTFNDWDPAAADARLRLRGNRYVGEVELPFGPVEFKFAADGNWDLNFGAADDAGHAPRDQPLVDDGPNLIAEIPVAGPWRFELNPGFRSFTMEFVGEATDGQQALLDAIADGRAPDIESPVVVGGEVVFFHRRTAGLTGDFQDWEAGPMVSTSGPMVYATRTFERGARHEYKLVDGERWFADPSNPNVAWDGIPNPGVGAFNSVLYTEGYAHEVGRLERFRWQSARLNDERDVYVFLPPGFEALEALPSLYVHDGNESITRSRMDLALGNAGIAVLGVFVALPNQNLRIAQYTYGEPESRGDAYVDALATELVPLVEARYPTVAGRRGIIGASLGGLISLHAAWRHPAVWTHIGSQSGSFFWAENEMVTRWTGAERHPDIDFYLDSGSPEDNHDVTILLRDALQATGYEVHHVVEEGAQHEWAAWGGRFAAAVAWMFGDR